MPIEFWYVLARANTLFTFTTRIQIQNPEAATAAKPLAQIQKTNPAAAEKLKAFLTTEGLDESKVGFPMGSILSNPNTSAHFEAFLPQTAMQMRLSKISCSE